MGKEHQIKDVYKVGTVVPLSLPIKKYNWKETKLFKERFMYLATEYTKKLTSNPGLSKVRAANLYLKVLESFNLDSHTNISIEKVKEFRTLLYYYHKKLTNLEKKILLMQEFGLDIGVIELFQLGKIIILKEFKILVNALSIIEPIIKDERIGITL